MRAISTLFILGVLYETQMAVNGLVSFDGLWNTFKTSFSKTYAEKEEAAIREKWEQLMLDNMNQNMRYMMGATSYQRGTNQFSDMDDDEFNRRMTGFKVDKPCNSTGRRYVRTSRAKPPAQVDWREKGAVTPVKNQYGCSCCWAFSTVGSFEGHHKLKTGNLVSLSEQHLLDCSEAFGNQGCQSGQTCHALEYAQHVHWIATEKSYPYEGRKGPCRFNRSVKGSKCYAYVDIPAGDEESLMYAVAFEGPIAAGFYATTEFHHYKSGIFAEPHCHTESPNHAITVIGYGTERGQDYWLIKNSWGTSWGENGYGKVARNRGNMCNIASYAMYPIV